MEQVVARGKVRAALARVRENRGSPGVDGMTVGKLPQYLMEHWQEVREQLLAGTYQPKPVLRREIPKRDGGMRGARHSVRSRPASPTGDTAGAAAALGPQLLGAQLRLPTGAQRARRRLARRISDTRLLRLIRRYLNAGMMADGVVMESLEGTPQGGPLSPLFAAY